MSSLPPLLDTDLRALARSLRRIDSTFLKAGEPGVERLWWQGAEPYFEVVVERDAAGLRWFQLSVRGRVVTYHRDRGVSTGESTEGQVASSLHPQSPLVKTHVRPEAGHLDVALRILDARADLSELDAPVDVLREARRGL